MRTISFRSVLYGIATKVGLEPAVNLQKNVAAAFVEYINTHLAWAVEKFWFPDLEIVEQRAFRPAYSDVQAYVQGDEVYDPLTDAYYRAAQPSTGAPLNDPDFWAEALVIPWLDMKAAGLAPIHRVGTLSARDPRSTDEPGDFDFTLTRDRIYLRGKPGKKVWVCFQTTPPLFSAEDFQSGQTYANGYVVYDATRGECYASVADGNVADITDGAWWQLVEFPWVLSTFVKKAAYADALREDGQNEKAREEENRARESFEDACETIALNQGQARRLGVAVRS